MRKTMITTGFDCGLAERIKKSNDTQSFTDFLKRNEIGQSKNLWCQDYTEQATIKVLKSNNRTTY